MKDSYCTNCGSCGEHGCCSYIKCFSKLIEKDECEYGGLHIREASFDKEISNLGFEIISNLENGLLNSDLAVIEYHRRWNEIYDRIFS